MPIEAAKVSENEGGRVEGGIGMGGGVDLNGESLKRDIDGRAKRNRRGESGRMRD
jgi:hypothetical protein